MTVHTRREVPLGHGEVHVEPPVTEWPDAMEENARALGRSEARVGDASLAALRRTARREAIALALEYTSELGIEHAEAPLDARRLVVTGHQPELYHPGVWVKTFLAERMRREADAVALDLVVDTDVFDTLTLRAPCLHPHVRVCDIPLAHGDGRTTYGGAPAPDPQIVAEFVERCRTALGTLPAPSIARHFEVFAAALAESVPVAGDLARALTAARRRYEEPARTRYLELGVASLAGGRAFRTLAAHIALDARRFRSVFNDALDAFRVRTGSRSSAQPFPDLGAEAGRVELPFWVVRSGVREAAYIQGRTLLAGEEALVELPETVGAAASALDSVGLVPRAVTLTMFARLCIADLFIHGIGGGRYDRVTDDVIRSYFGVEPPSYAVASMTLYLPIGAHVVSDDEIAEVEQRLHRLEHNPDQLLERSEFDDDVEASEARELAARKATLVEQISRAGADKKRLGSEIREVNARLTQLLEPLVRETRDELVTLREQREASGVLTDRTYPYCLWDPCEVMDKVT
ncbi:MAG: hypothetical protein Kow0067_18830 [Coriobacteriia bacterium]